MYTDRDRADVPKLKALTPNDSAEASFDVSAVLAMTSGIDPAAVPFPKVSSGLSARGRRENAKTRKTSEVFETSEVFGAES
jgi:hypothetical protein